MSVENVNNSNEGREPAASGRNGPNVTLIALLVAIALFVIFFLQNGRKQRIDFLFFGKTTTIRWSLLVAVALGIVLDRVFTMWWRRRKRSQE